jgi:WD40 repeat protein
MAEVAATVGRPRRTVWAFVGVLLVGLISLVAWLATRGEELATLRGHTGPVRALAIDADHNLLASTGDDGRLRLWNLRTNRSGGSVSTHAAKATGLAVLSSRAEVVRVGPEHKASVWSLPAGEPVRTIELPIAPECVAASADGRHLAVGGSDGQVRLFTPADSTAPKTFKTHTKPVHCLAFTPDGSRLASGGTDGFVRLWDTATGQPRVQLAVGNHRVFGLAVSPDGTRLVAAIAGAGLRGWTIADGQEMPAFGDEAGMAWCVAFSPDGIRLVSGHEDGSVKVWEAAPPRVLRTYRGHRLLVLSVAFAPDGASVFSASGDGTIKRWKAPGQ